MSRAGSAGKIEVRHTYCYPASSYEYVPEPASNRSGRYDCPQNTRAQKVSNAHINLALELLPVQGATTADACTCVSGFYAEQFNLSKTLCVPCPTGSECFGHDFPPVARQGYGGLHGPQAIQKLYACPGKERCPGSECDCIGGVVRTNGTVVFRCAVGYLQGSALCSLCAEGYARRMRACSECGADGLLYLLLAIFVSLAWFPLLGTLLAEFEALEIVINFVQFLGLCKPPPPSTPSPSACLRPVPRGVI